jgi:hypothetical protein
MKEIENAGRTAEKDLKLDPIYAPARWSDVRRFKFKVQKVKVRMIAHTVTSWEVNESEREEARRRFLIAVKASYWQQVSQCFHHGKKFVWSLHKNLTISYLFRYFRHTFTGYS